MGPSSRIVRAIALLLALIAVCCSKKNASQPPLGEVRVNVSVRPDRESGAFVVMLEDKPHQRALPIWIDEAQARSIMLELHGITPERPMTNDLLRSVLETVTFADLVTRSQVIAAGGERRAPRTPRSARTARPADRAAGPGR